MPNNELVRAIAEPWIFLPTILILGLVVGSFLNVVAYRLPLVLQNQWRRECSDLLEQDHNSSDENEPEYVEDSFNLSFPNSHCPNCKVAINARHNIPIIGYLLLRGKCHACKQKISIRYPIVELTSALMSLAIALQYGHSLTTIALLFFTWSLIVLTLIDADTMLLPDDITLPLLWLGLIVNYFGLVTDFSSAFWGAVVGYGVLWSLFWVFKLITGKEGMGYGDFKLLAALGAWLGWQALPIVIILSSFVGAFIGIGMILLRGQDKQIPIPFGPYLAIAGWIALIWGADLSKIYFQFSGIA